MVVHSYFLWFIYIFLVGTLPVIWMGMWWDSPPSIFKSLSMVLISSLLITQDVYNFVINLLSCQNREDQVLLFGPSSNNVDHAKDQGKNKYIRTRTKESFCRVIGTTVNRLCPVLHLYTCNTAATWLCEPHYNNTVCQTLY